MSKHELEVFRSYMRDGAEVGIFGNEGDAAAFLEWLSTASLYELEAPDLCFVKDDTVLIAEHFEFDNMDRNRNGSQFRRENARINRRIESLMNDGKTASFTDEITGISSYENFIRNATDSFEEHYRKIEDYKQNLREKELVNDSTQIKVMFIMEDVSPLGSVVGPNAWDESLRIVNLAQSREYLDLLKDHENVDYVLAFSSYNGHRFVWLIDRNHLDACYTETIDFASLNFISFQPQVVGGAVTIPYTDNNCRAESEEA